MNDPAMQGTPPDTRAACYSLAEMDALCRRAARGAGCPWGLAEEAGKAARWLASYGLPGAEAVAGLLTTPRNCPCSGSRGPACSLRLGATISDRAGLVEEGEQSAEVAQPLLLLALLGRAASATGRSFRLEWEKHSILCGGDGIEIEKVGDLPSNLPSNLLSNLLSARAEARWCPTAASPASPLRRESPARAVSASAWKTLETLAGQTYVPESDASRLAGAGAGITDND